jgi:hypothetical protein
MKFSISFKYSGVTFKNKETKETIAYDTKASEGNTFTFDNVDEDVVIGMLKGIKDKKASQLFAYDDIRTNFINVMARNKCKELYDKLDKAEWKIEDIAVSNITIKDVEFTKPTMNAREAITVESISRKNYTKGAYPTYVVKERLVDLIEGCPRENPMWADLVEILAKYYGEAELEQVMESKKTTNESAEPVIFKKDKRNNEVIAFFPETMFDGSVNRGNIMSYAHNGQHGEASLEYFQSCKPCPEEEYADLLTELEGIYTDGLTVVKKANYGRGKNRRQMWPTGF